MLPAFSLFHFQLAFIHGESIERGKVEALHFCLFIPSPSVRLCMNCLKSVKTIIMSYDFNHDNCFIL